jgi:hypothetical protein
VTEKVQETASRVANTVQDAAAPILDQAGDKASQVTDHVMDQAASRLDMGKEYAVETLNSVAQALRQTGQHLREDGSQPRLGQYADAGAHQLEKFTGHLHQRDANELLSEVEAFARRSPALFSGTAFALGLLTARFFRSSGQRSQSQSLMSRTPSGRFTQPAPLNPPGNATSTTPGQMTGQRPGPLSTAPAARNIPPSPEWSPSPSDRASTGTNTGTQAPQRTPSPGSLPSSGSSASRPSESSPAHPESGTGATPSGPNHPQPGSRTSV